MLCNVFPLQYPQGIRSYEYIPSFAIRGLHYDVQKVTVPNVKNAQSQPWLNPTCLLFVYILIDIQYVY